MSTDILEMISKRIDDNYYEAGEEEYNNILSYCNEMFSDIVGQDEVKNEVLKIANYLNFVNKVKDRINLANQNLNMIFTGNPGTGKTTISRIICDIFNKLNVIENPVFVEATPKDFIAEYVGQTAAKTRNFIDKYKGGIIFIDEAYAFTSGKEKSNNSFSGDAITEIIKEMEKKETIFIFAGYKKEINKFLDLNPGIKSRIGYNIDFDDYSADELKEMLKNKIRNSGFKIERDALNYLYDIVATRRKNKNFGNGRMIDNLFDEMVREHAFATINTFDEDELLIIREETVKKIKLNNEKMTGGYFNG